MINYNWNHPDNVLEMGIGLSCCPSPKEADLSKVWSRHRTSIIDLLSSLQGIHIIVQNLDERVRSEKDVFAYIRELNLKLNFKSDSSHLWHLLPNGSYTIEVTVAGLPNSMVKYMVPIQLAEFTEVVFVLPPNEMMPKFIVLFLMVCTSMVILICVVMFCRCCSRANYINTGKWLHKIDQRGAIRGSKVRGGKHHHRPSHDGFQLLARGGSKAKSLFEDDDESEDDILDKSIKQYGLKMPPVKIYHDEFSSQSSEDELPSYEQNSFSNVKQNGGGRVDVIERGRRSQNWPTSRQEKPIKM